MTKPIHFARVFVAVTTAVILGAALLLVSQGSAVADTAGTMSASPEIETSALQSVSFTTTLTRMSDAGVDDTGTREAIYCGGTVSYPYQNGTSVRTDVKAWCTAVVDSIEVWAGILAGSSLVDLKYLPRSSAVANGVSAATRCAGYTVAYKAIGMARFTKAGYHNSPLVLSGETPYVNITC